MQESVLKEIYKRRRNLSGDFFTACYQKKNYLLNVLKSDCEPRIVAVSCYVLPEEVKSLNRALSLITGLSSKKPATLYFDHYFVPVNEVIPFKEKVYFNQQLKHYSNLMTRIGQCCYADHFFSYKNLIYFENASKNTPFTCISSSCNWTIIKKFNLEAGVLYRYCPVEVESYCLFGKIEKD